MGKCPTSLLCLILDFTLLIKVQTSAFLIALERTSGSLKLGCGLRGGGRGSRGRVMVKVRSSPQALSHFRLSRQLPSAQPHGGPQFRNSGCAGGASGMHDLANLNTLAIVFIFL